jgi:formyltetrahydrofolate deformylase
MPTTRLLLACTDRPGLIAAVSGFLADAGLNIVDADQHSSNEGRFFMRMEFDAVPEAQRGELQDRFEREIAERFEMDHRFAESSERKRLAIMV